jgi:hypothetical protein
MSGRDTPRPSGLPVTVGVIGLALIMVGQVGVNRPSIEDDLTSRSVAALNQAGLNQLTVSFSGRDATISGGDSEQAARGDDVVGAVDGVRVVTTATDSESAARPTTDPATAGTEPAATTAAAATSKAPRPDVVPVGFTLAEGTITVTGTMNSAGVVTELLDEVKTVPGWQVTNKLTVDETLDPVEPAAGTATAVAAMLATVPVDGPTLVIQYNEGKVILRGTAADSQVEADLLAAAGPTVRSKADVIDGLDTPATK